MKQLASVLQLTGLVILVTGVWMYSATAGLIVSGLTLTFVGIALERAN
jgi:hypothetical protein